MADVLLEEEIRAQTHRRKTRREDKGRARSDASQGEASVETHPADTLTSGFQTLLLLFTAPCLWYSLKAA